MCISRVKDPIDNVSQISTHRVCYVLRTLYFAEEWLGSIAMTSRLSFYNLNTFVRTVSVVFPSYIGGREIQAVNS